MATKQLHLPKESRVKAFVDSLLHKEVKKHKESTVITWYFLYILFFFLLYIGSIIYLLLVVLRPEPSHPREIIIPCGTLGYSHKRVWGFINTKLCVRR